MKLKFLTPILLLAGITSASYAQTLFTFESGVETWLANDGTLSSSTSNATQGTKSLQWSRPDGWTRIYADLSDAQVAQLAASTSKKLLIDTTITDGGAYWRQNYIIFNSTTGGWQQSGSPVGLTYQMNGRQTAVLNYADLVLPSVGDETKQLHLVLQSGGASDPSEVWMDNVRIENSTLVESFEGGVSNVQADGSVTLSQDTTGATVGTKALKVSWGSGFQWMGINLTEAQAAIINNSPTHQLLFDITIPSAFSAGWGNCTWSLNDTANGWRQASKQIDWPAFNGGQVSLALDLSGLGLLDVSSGSFRQINFGINTGGTGEFYIDNIRAETAPGTAVSGTVNLGDWSGGAGTVATFKIYNGATLVDTKTATLDAAGNYSFTTTATGTVKIIAKASHWLAKAVTSTIGSTFTFSLKNGDIDNDNFVTILDYSVLSDYFDKANSDGDWSTVGGNGFAPKDADLDGDGSVSILDYSYLSDNFDIEGDN